MPKSSKPRPGISKWSLEALEKEMEASRVKPTNNDLGMLNTFTNQAAVMFREMARARKEGRDENEAAKKFSPSKKDWDLLMAKAKQAGEDDAEEEHEEVEEEHEEVEEAPEEEDATPASSDDEDQVQAFLTSPFAKPAFPKPPGSVEQATPKSPFQPVPKSPLTSPFQRPGPVEEATPKNPFQPVPKSPLTSPFQRPGPVEEASTSKRPPAARPQYVEFQPELPEAHPAASQGQPVIEDVSQGPQPDEIFLLARQQNFEVATKLLESHPSLWKCTDEDGHSLLHWAALVGNKDFVNRGLVTGRLEVDSVANNQQTPLMWACLRGHVPVARQLLAHQASLTAKDSLGATALMIAVQHKSYPSMLLLLHRGRAIQDQMIREGDKNGCTAAHWAAYKGDLTALKLLHYFKADLQVLDSARMMPLHRAVCASQGAVVEFLVEQRSDPQARNNEGKSCMDIAAEKQDIMMQGLLKRLLQKTPMDSFGGAKVDPEDLEAAKDKAEEKKKAGFFKGLMQDKAAHKIFPVFWLVCVSLAVFQYIMDIRRASYEVAPTTSFIFELLVPLSLAIFSYVALGDPGKVPSRPVGNSGVEELMKTLDTDAADINPPDVNRLCTTTWVLKGLRTKYCVQTGACVEEFDHYCVWLNNTIGRGNHRQFVGLAIVEFLTQLTHLRLCLLVATTLVPYATFGQFVWGVITGYPLLTLIVLVHCITAPWVCMLTIHQARLVLMNMTTNEMMNLHRYEHFWKVKYLVTGHVHKSFQNPFHKGSAFKNCLDFWWYRQRGTAVEQHECCSGCDSHV